MRYPAAEKLEIIRLVEQSPLPVRHTLAKLGIPRATFYRWYDRYSRGGPEALNDRSPRPERVWNRIPDAVRDNVIQLALDEPARPHSAPLATSRSGGDLARPAAVPPHRHADWPCRVGALVFSDVERAWRRVDAGARVAAASRVGPGTRLTSDRSGRGRRPYRSDAGNDHRGFRNCNTSGSGWLSSALAGSISGSPFVCDPTTYSRVRCAYQSQ